MVQANPYITVTPATGDTAAAQHVDRDLHAGSRHEHQRDDDPERERRSAGGERHAAAGSDASIR